MGQFGKKGSGGGGGGAGILVETGSESKISDFTDGAPAQSTDIVPLARSGTNRRVTIANIFTLLLSAARSWVSGANTTTISDTGVGVSDATDSGSLNSNGVTITDGTAQTTLTKASLQIADGGGNTLNADVDDVTVSDGVNIGAITPGGVAASGAAGSIVLSAQVQINTEVATGAVWVESKCKITLTDTELMSAYTVPIEIAIPLSPAAGKILVPTSVVAKKNYVEAFTTATRLMVLTLDSDVTDYIWTTGNEFLAEEGDIIELMRPNELITKHQILTENKKIIVMTDADSITGTGTTVDLYITCELISF